MSKKSSQKQHNGEKGGKRGGIRAKLVQQKLRMNKTPTKGGTMFSSATPK